ncbi:MAG: methylated-DNA--[protein]-cysteine S-methyltransferase, partial [Dehalococcoidia bacterium]
SPDGLKGIILPQASIELVCQAAMRKYGIVQVDSSAYSGTLLQRLRSYFEGNYTEFPDELDLSDTTDFQRSIWETTRTIPYGETRSYSWVANEAGYQKAPRAAGNALGENPFPIIVPCHRVIRSNGGLGGFTAGGTEVKEYLLQLEQRVVVPYTR